MHILYLHPASAFGGASKSLIELFRELKKSGIRGTVLTPAGSASKAFSEEGFEVREIIGISQFDNTRYGHYRGLRWIILLRELFLLPASIAAIFKFRRNHFDVVHINDLTLLPIGIFAKWLYGAPLVVHIRSLQVVPNSNFRTRFINNLLKKYASAAIAIDQTVAGTMSKSIQLNIVHNSIKIDQFDKLDLENQNAKSKNRVPRIGLFGVLIALKGVFELIEAVKILKERGCQFECFIAGENARELSGFKEWILKRLGFAQNVREEIIKLIDSYGLHEQVKLLGFVSDVRALYPKIDILCFPSHLNAAGRPVFEAAFFGIPSVVAVENPLSDAVLHGVTGLAIKRPDPVLIADALQYLIENDDARMRLGEQAKQWAIENFSVENSAALVQKIYRNIIH